MIYRPHTYYLLFLFLIFYALSSSASDDDFRDHMLSGSRALRDENFSLAYKEFKAAHEMAPDSLAPVQYLGQVEFKREKWGEAKEWFEKVLKINKEDIAAHYYLGICHRETGKYKALLLRKLEFRKAQRYLKFVMENSPSYGLAFYEYGVLLKYREHFTEAVDFAERQLAYKPASDQALVGLHKLYDSMLYHKNGEELREWFAERNTPRARFYIGESYRRSEDFARADSVFMHLMLLPDSVVSSKTPIRMALARLRYQQGRIDECEDYFHQALDSAKTLFDVDFLFEEMKYIFTDAELESYRSLKTAELKRVFLSKMWQIRNPLFATERNPRMVEHIRRVLVAEKDYRFDGVRSKMNSPDKLQYLTYPKVFYLNDKYNDKGLVYIRHGEPDDRAFMNGQGIPENESWLYYRQQSTPKLMFHFLIDESAGPTNWRLSPTLPLYMAESRLDFDPIFYRILTADALESNSLQLELADKSRRDVEVGLNSDRHSWNNEIIPIGFPFYVATFSGENGATRYELYFGLTHLDIWPKMENYAPDKKVTAYFSATDESWNTVYHDQLDVSAKDIKFETDMFGMWVNQFRFDANPGLHFLNIIIRVADENKVGGYKYHTTIGSYGRGSLQMSKLELAREILATDETDKFVKNGLRVIPQPVRTFSKKNPIYVYFEVYNLPVENSNRLGFNVTYKIKQLRKENKSILAKISGIFSGGMSETFNTVERFADQRTSVEYLALDLNKQSPGDYRLEVLTFVPETGQADSSSIKFFLK
jgi:tetratricopeptide (TPR) repeat protein